MTINELQIQVANELQTTGKLKPETAFLVLTTIINHMQNIPYFTIYQIQNSYDAIDKLLKSTIQTQLVEQEQPKTE